MPAGEDLWHVVGVPAGGAVAQAGLAGPGRLVAEGAARTSTGRSPDQIIEAR